MRQAGSQIIVDTPRQGFHEITATIERWVAAQGLCEGLLTVFCRHTSASLLIQENAAREVRSDIETYFAALAPESDAYLHDDEGPDDMPAHLRAALTQVSCRSR
jgi:secondary thiamine-phosphate synthase enzyme